MSNTGSVQQLLGSRGSSHYHHFHHSHHHLSVMDNSSVNGIRDAQLTPLWELIKQSPYRLIVGSVILSAAVLLLVWNEGHAVRTSQSLDEGYDSVVALPTADIITTANDGKVIHVSGALSTSPSLTDYRYNVEIESVRLKRRVQMFQWVEEEELLEGEPVPMHRESSPDVSYSYSTAWKDKLVDSNLFNIPFGHENPTPFPLESEIQVTEVVKIGGYFLSPAIVEAFTSFQPFSGDEEPVDVDVRLHAGMYYQTKDIFNPQVGDIRVQFYYAGLAGDTYSIIGIQRGKNLLPYTSSSGQELVLLQHGQRSPEEVFATHHAHTRLYNWGVRVTGFGVLCIAVSALHPLAHALVCRCRLLRDVAAMSGGHLTMTVAMSLSLAITAASWCVYRPGLAVCLGLLALLPAVRSGYNAGGGTGDGEHGAGSRGYGTGSSGGVDNETGVSGYSR